MTKVVVAGARDYKPDVKAYDWLVATLRQLRASQVISGGAMGADRFGEQTAERIGLEVHRETPDWNAHGKAAGPIRNRKMAEMCDCVVLFPGGRGTASMRREAEKLERPVYEYLG